MAPSGIKSFTVEWVASGRGKARCAPDPDYPNGIALDCSQGAGHTCIATLPYPAPECGMWIVRCRCCPMSCAVTAAGRPDDPTSVKMPCQFDPVRTETA